MPRLGADSLSDQQRIGVFGGTFDPIHNTHLELARAAQQQAGLDAVLFVVSATPPHKRTGVCLEAEDRYAMVSAALANEPGFAPSRIELDRVGPSYTADTLDQLAAAHPGAALFLILGMDAVRDLPGWHQPQRILDRAHLLAARRPDAELPPMLAGHCTLLDFEERAQSSSAIRQRIANGEAVDHLLPPAVWQMIEQHGWYGHDRVRSHA